MRRVRIPSEAALLAMPATQRSEMPDNINKRFAELEGKVTTLQAKVGELMQLSGILLPVIQKMYVQVGATQAELEQLHKAMPVYTADEIEKLLAGE